jgi:hypothetical protein
MLPIASTGGIQTQQDIYTNEQINLSLQFQYQQLANAIDFSNNMNDKNSSLFQLNRRPITGFNNTNRAAKNKFKTNHQQNISACQPFMSPVLASPSGKYSRKVFVGGLPPDIDESKSFI